MAPSGDLAVALRVSSFTAFTRTGTLARVGATGGAAPRELLEGVQFADWSPDGRDLAVVRAVSGRTRLEMPIGKVLYNDWLGRRPSLLSSRRSDRLPGPPHGQR